MPILDARCDICNERTTDVEKKDDKWLCKKCFTTTDKQRLIQHYDYQISVLQQEKQKLLTPEEPIREE